MKNQSIAKVAIALLKNMGACGFSDSLNYRARAHRTNNEQLAEAISMMLGTLSLHQNDADVSGLRLRVNGLSKAKSKAQMNWQVDDLLNHLLGLVDKAEEERAIPKLKQVVIGGKVVCRGEVVTVIGTDLDKGTAMVQFCSGEVETVMGCKIALMATPFPTCLNPEDKPEPSPVSVLTMFNGPAKPTPKPYTEATDPETGHTYRVDSHGRILVRQAGSSSFYAGNCNVYVVKAVIRLGLLNAPKPEPAPEMAQRVAQNVACELLAKMEAWGFDGSVGIVERLGDMVACNGLAVRLQSCLTKALAARFTGLGLDTYNALHDVIKAHCVGWGDESAFLENWKAAHAKLTKIAITGKTDDRES